MIRITIERVTRESHKETKNYIVSKEPSGKSKPSSYGNHEEPLFNEKYEPREVEEWETITTLLLKQEIPDGAESDFQLTAVIQAINNIPVSAK